MTCENIILLLIQFFVALVLFLTFLAVVWYAFETRKLWKETVKQTRLSMRPIVVITYGDDRFSYINYGNTPAFNIKIDDVTLINTDNLRFDYVFPEIAVLPQSTKIKIEDIKIRINDDVRDTGTFELGALIPYSASRTFNVKIRYKNSENDEYITQGKVGEGAFEFSSIEKIS